jgi:hypothetical protein
MCVAKTALIDTDCIAMDEPGGSVRVSPGGELEDLKTRSQMGPGAFKFGVDRAAKREEYR